MLLLWGLNFYLTNLCWQAAYCKSSSVRRILISWFFYQVLIHSILNSREACRPCEYRKNKMHGNERWFTVIYLQWYHISFVEPCYAYPNHRSMNRVNVKCAVLPRKTRATSLWHHKITSKYYEVGQENWHFIFIEMRQLQPISEIISKVFLSGAFRLKFFIWRYCKYKEWTWVRQWQIFREPLRGSRDLSLASPKFIFPWTQKKRRSFLNCRLVSFTFQCDQILPLAGRPLHNPLPVKTRLQHSPQ